MACDLNNNYINRTIIATTATHRNALFIIAAGASAGGMKALCEFVDSLPGKINAALFLVLHLSEISVGDILVQRLKKFTSIPCKLAEDNETITAGHIYVAPPDYHLIIKKGKLLLRQGPREDRWRPSINVMMRSAAVAYSEYVIGVTLTGLLNDGTSGMLAIKKCGGITMVQDPHEAEFPDMPLSVLNNMQVDHCVSLERMEILIKEIITRFKPKGISVPEDIAKEAEISEKTITTIQHVASIATETVFSCPDCGGGL